MIAIIFCSIVIILFSITLSLSIANDVYNFDNKGIALQVFVIMSFIIIFIIILESSLDYI